MGRGGVGQGSEHGCSFDVIVSPDPIDLRDRGKRMCICECPNHMDCGLDTGMGGKPELLRRGGGLKFHVVLLCQGAGHETADDIPDRETTDP